MVKIVGQTKEEKLEMYMKLEKRELAEMLINCNMLLEHCSKQLQQYSVSSQVCRTFFSDNSSTSATRCKFCGKEQWQH